MTETDVDWKLTFTTDESIDTDDKEMILEMLAENFEEFKEMYVKDIKKTRGSFRYKLDGSMSL